MLTRLSLRPITRRKLLLALALTALLADLILIALWRRPVPLAIEADLTVHAYMMEAKNIGNYPTFDPGKGSWTVRGRKISDLSSYLINSDPDHIGPDGIGSYFPMVLRDSEGLEALRLVVSDLALRGICQIAVFETSALSSDGYVDAGVISVTNYRDVAGIRRTCVDHVNDEWHREERGVLKPVD